jgi:hypothetical protein
MRLWGKRKEDVSVLADAFFQNDPYFPRPRDGGSVYKFFREGYLMVDQKNPERLEAFFSEIEKRDGVMTSGV